MPVTAGEIGLAARRYGNGRQFQPGFLPVKRRQQRPPRLVAGSSGEGAGRDFHSASMMSDSDGSFGAAVFQPVNQNGNAHDQHQQAAQTR